jgi:hypothetical protein
VDKEVPDSKLKVVAMKGKRKEQEEDVMYINPELMPVIEYISKYVELYGCSEIQIIMLDSDMNADIEGTSSKSTTGLGAMVQATLRYWQDLEDECEEVSE